MRKRFVNTLTILPVVAYALGLACMFGTAASESTELTLQNVDDKVLNHPRNAFVKFYAPW